MLLTVFAYIGFAGLLFAVAVVDMRTLRIPNTYILALAGLWLVWRALLGLGGLMVGTDFVTSAIAPDPLEQVSFASGVIGAVVLGGGLLVATALYEAITKKRAMGGGDIKLLAVIGLFLGLERGVVCLLVACVCSIVASFVVPRVNKHHRHEEDEPGEQALLKEIPFGPALAVGSAVAVIIM